VRLGAGPRALLGVFALIVAITLAAAPLVDARPKDKNGGNRNDVAAETVPADQPAPASEQPLTADEGNVANDRSMIESDADGDYIPDALDNCANVQNPDQSDADGDGHGDACPVYQDTDGDTVPDTNDNCPSVATSDYSDRDGDGVGDPCDKSPDGVEPEPEPVPELDGGRGQSNSEPPPPENGEGENGKEVIRDGRSRTKQRERTDISRPTITTGSDSGTETLAEDPAEDAVGGPPAQSETALEEPVRDNPRRNEELIAEAAASGELYADPEPPPTPRRTWDDEAAGAMGWEPLVRIDAGAANDAVSPVSAAPEQAVSIDEPNDAGRPAAIDRPARQPRNQTDEEVGDSGSARGWVRAKLQLQDELQSDEEAGDENAGGGRRGNSAPVPVENGLVITAEPADTAADASADAPQGRQETGSARADRAAPRDGSRRNGSSRSAAAETRQRPREDATADAQVTTEPPRQRRTRRARANGGVPGGWSDDRYFTGGSALNWTGEIEVAGTDDDGLYLTQRSGTGPGKRRGFEYAIPVAENGVYLVRLYFAEPYWGASGGPEGGEGRRVFSVIGEGELLLEDLDVFAESGAVTALVKQVEIVIEDGELNLRFTASEGEPMVAAIELLQPAG